MSIDPETTRIVRSWLAHGATRLPERVLDDVLDRLAATPQRRGTWPARTLVGMNAAVKLAAAAAVLVVAALGVYYASGMPRVGIGGPQPSTSGDPTPVPTAEASSTDSQDQVIATGAEPSLAIRATVPDSWLTVTNGYVAGEDTSGRTNPFVVFWTIETVYIDPCHWESSDQVDAAPLDVDGLASALSSSWVGGAASLPATAPVATTPTDVTFAGFQGKYLELRIPEEVDFATCDAGLVGSGQYRIWLSSDNSVRYLQGPGQSMRLWILDVGGAPLVVNANILPDHSTQQLAEMEQVLESIEILPGG